MIIDFNGMKVYAVLHNVNDSYDSNICMLTNKGSYVTEYQLIETGALSVLINCNHVYLNEALIGYQKKKYYNH